MHLEFDEYAQHSETTTVRKFIEQFVDKGYKKDVVIQPIQKVNELYRK